MLAVTRLRVPGGAEEVEAGLRAVLAALGARPGFVAGRVARAVDDAGLLALVTEWSGAGDYRRALSAYDLKVAFADLMPFVVDEPSAYEVVDSL